MKLGDTNSQVEQPLVQYGSNVVTTDAFGSATVTLPLAFADAGGVNPTNHRVVVTNGDPNSATQNLSFWVGILAGGHGYQHFTASVMYAGAGGAQPVANGAVRLDWIAIGPRL